MTTPNTKKSKFYAWLALPLTVIMFFAFAEKVPAIVPVKNKNSETPKGNFSTEAQNQNDYKNHSEEHLVVDPKKDSPELSPDSIKKGSKNQIKSQFDTIKPNEHQELPAGPPPQPVQQSKKEEKINQAAENEVDKLPVYPGGLNVFRQKIAQEFNSAVFNGDEGKLQSNVFILISEKGEVIHFGASGSSEKFNNEISRAVLKTTKDVVWEPAEKDGKKVPYHLRLPISMTFEKNPGLKKQ